MNITLGMKKTVFESKEEREQGVVTHKGPSSLKGYRNNANSRQQMQAANALGNIFMKGAKDKLTGKILLPSTIVKKKNDKT